MHIISIVTLSIFIICWIVVAFATDDVYDMIIKPLMCLIGIVFTILLLFSIGDLIIFILTLINT